jgi:hypothetical protein
MDESVEEEEKPVLVVLLHQHALQPGQQSTSRNIVESKRHKSNLYNVPVC